MARIPATPEAIVEHLNELGGAEFIELNAAVRYLSPKLKTTQQNARKWLNEAIDSGAVVHLLAQDRGSSFQRMEVIPEDQRVDDEDVRRWRPMDVAGLAIDHTGQVTEFDSAEDFPAENSEWIITEDEFEKVVEGLIAKAAPKRTTKKPAESKDKEDELYQTRSEIMEKILTHMNGLGVPLNKFSVEFHPGPQGLMSMNIYLVADQIEAFADSLPDKE